MLDGTAGRRKLRHMKSLSSFEEAVIRKFCEMNDLPINNLSDHVLHLQATNREFTGVGIYVELVSSLDAKGETEAVVTGISAEATDGRPMLGFILYLNESKPTLLEGFSYSDSWPTELDGYSLSFG